MKRTPLLVLCALLVGCDEPTVISHVDRARKLDLRDLFLMQDEHGIPVETHGAPFRRPDVRDLVPMMKVPAGGPQDIPFYGRAVGLSGSDAGADHSWRLVLHFNPQGGVPNAVRDCMRSEPAETAGPTDSGFSVNAVFCQGQRWQAHGYMRVLEIEDGDIEAFQRVMRLLLKEIFADNVSTGR